MSQTASWPAAVDRPALWEHQRRGLIELTDMLDFGECKVCLTSPTGGGKSRMMVELIDWGARDRRRVILYSNRRMLTDQIVRTLDNFHIDFGVRAAGYRDYEDLAKPIQISSTATENSRVYRSGRWSLHPADLVLIDEIHNQKAEMMTRLLEDHLAAGAKAVGVTATPLGVSHLFDKLVVAGTNSELRRCGALVRCDVYGCAEMDTRHIKRRADGEYSERDIVKKCWTWQIFGKILEWWRRLNPEAKPTILFAPGVKESIWTAKQFTEAGVRAAHIDGDTVWFDGHTYESNRHVREDVVNRVRSGDIKVICNRFVMREGIDIPELYHCILATPMGTLLTYLQTVGRVLRAHPSMDHVIMQDHAGNWWRNGSPNADIDWRSVYNMPARVATDHRLEQMREKKIPEPITCPRCKRTRTAGRSCPQCGFMADRNVREIIQVDGRMATLTGDIMPARPVRRRQDTESLWRRMFHRAINAGNRGRGMTFRQAYGLFFVENYYYPPKDLPLMPQHDLDWFRDVRDVPMEDLR